MESTGIYWKPVYNILEGYFEITLANAQRIKNVPGRELTRLRKKWVGNLTAEKNRIQKVLECSNIKLGTVISDVFGVSGRNLLTQLVAQGFIDETNIEHRAKGQVKKKVSAISESLFGTLTEHQIFMIRQSWSHLTFLEESIQQLDQKIEEHLQFSRKK